MPAWSPPCCQCPPLWVAAPGVRACHQAGSRDEPGGRCTASRIHFSADESRALVHSVCARAQPSPSSGRSNGSRRGQGSTSRARCGSRWSRRPDPPGSDLVRRKVMEIRALFVRVRTSRPKVATHRHFHFDYESPWWNFHEQGKTWVF